MDCKTFQKYAGAFADGELGVELSLEAEEHLKACPRCTQRVTSITGMRTALQRVLDPGPPPPSLVDKIETSLEREAARPRRQHITPKRAARPRIARPALVTGMAAAGVFIAALAWYTVLREPAARFRTVDAGRALADAWRQHQACSHHAAEHHNPALPQDLEALARRLSDDLHLLVIAPDLSPRGFELLGADRCGVLGRRGAHVLYQARASKQPLSVFTVERWHGLGGYDARSLPDSVAFVSQRSSGHVVAWHAGPQTYALCGSLPSDELLGLAGWIRTADAADARFRMTTGPLLALAD